MKTIYLIRHAKSDWNHSGLTDFERPLNNRGSLNAPLMGEKLKELKVKFDAVVSSPSKRTTETINEICVKLGFPLEDITFDKDLYLPSLNDLTNAINQIKSSINSLAIVCHNPGITSLSNYLTEDYIDNIVTCGIVKIELEIDSWYEIVQGIGTKKYYIYPKMFN
jgi:phosphohistidine phosphatase